MRSRFPISRLLKMTDQAFPVDMIGHFCLGPIPDRNLFNDDRLAELVDEARDVVNGLSTGELRQDGNLRRYVADEINQLRVAIDGALEDLPRRKIRLAA